MLGLPVPLQNGFCKLLATAARLVWVRDRVVRLLFLVAVLCFSTASFDLARPTVASELDATRVHRTIVKAKLTWDNVSAKSGYWPV